ncbi:MAG: TIGR04211 family SH3 domain-containing protein [Desulfobacteraceae bacterium]|nr:TIGR04211 family SH3 domain-containing protein [Desulfobacteraceae bacterium]
MHKLIFVLLFSAVASIAAAAQGVFVSDSLEIPLRSGPTTEYRILAMLPSGTPLDVLEEAQDWSRVRTQSGQEGWVRKRDLSRELPGAKVIERLKRENDQLKATAEQATTRAKALEGKEQELSTMTREYTSLQGKAQDAADLGKKYDAVAARLKSMTAEKEALAAETRELRSGVRRQWFLTGAGVVGISWLAGFVMGRLQRKNKRSSLY